MSERVLHVLSVMIASGLNQTIPNHGALSAYADIFAQVIQRRTNTSGFLHNHPSGDPSPSPDDMALTRRLIDAGKLLGVDVLDHIVIGDGRYVSFRELGWL